MLGDYQGVALCDGYKAYDTLAKEREASDLVLAHCWARSSTPSARRDRAPGWLRLPGCFSVRLSTGHGRK